MISAVDSLKAVWIYVIVITVGVLNALSIVFPNDFLTFSLLGHITFIFLIARINILKSIWLLISISLLVSLFTLLNLYYLGAFLSLPKYFNNDLHIIVETQQLLFQTNKTESWKSKMSIYSLDENKEKFIPSQNLDILLTVEKSDTSSYKNKIIKVPKGQFISLVSHVDALGGFDIYKLSKGLIISLKAYEIAGMKQAKVTFFGQRIESINDTLSNLKWGNNKDTNTFFKSVLWAKKEMLTKSTKVLFKELGLSHLLIVSGFHVGLLFLIVRIFFFIFKPLTMWHFTFSLLQIFILCLYAFAICGGSPSVTRAVIMASVAIVAHALDRKVTGYHLLGVSTIIILVVNPLWLLDIGFLLSFVAVLGILMALELSDLYIKSGNKVLNFLWSNIVVTIGAQLFTMPIVLSSFGEWYSIGLLSSVLLGVIFSIFIGLGLLTIPFLGVASLQGYLYIFLDFLFLNIMTVCKWLHGIHFLDIKEKIDFWQACLLFFILLFIYILKKRREYMVIAMYSYFIFLLFFILF